MQRTGGPYPTPPLSGVQYFSHNFILKTVLIFKPKFEDYNSLKVWLTKLLSIISTSDCNKEYRDRESLNFSPSCFALQAD